MAKKWKDMSGGEKLQNGFAGLIVFALIYLGISIATTDVKKPTSVAMVSKEIKSVSSVNGFLNVDVDLDEKYDAGARIFSASDIVLESLKVLKRGASDAKLETLQGATFTFSVPTISSFGEEGRSDLINIVLSRQSLDRVQPDKISTFDIVEIAQTELPSRIGVEAAQGYCDEQAKFSRRFCAAVDNTRTGGLFMSPN